MRDPLRVEMAVAVDIDRHGAAAVAARDHLEAEEARELELLPERPHRTPLTNARAAEGRRRGRAARAARQLRLIGAAAMLDAIGEAGIHRLAAEMEVGLARVPHRPAADAVVEVEQARLVGDLRAWLRGHEAARRRGRDRRLLVAGPLTDEAAEIGRAHV